jgi:D-alanyl-D-alanine carboxypeptidase
MHKTKLKILIALTAAFVFFMTGCKKKPEPLIHPASFDVERIDSLFSLLAESNRAMGSISIFEDGKEVYSNQIGFRDLSNGRHHDRNTIFRVGSISKTFLAAVIMQMAEEGHLTLETKLNNFFPEVTNSENITIKQMLQHRSGVFSYTADNTFEEWGYVTQSKESILHRIAGYESVFEPGTEESYSNSNYFLLALIAEKIDGIAYDMVIDRRIVKPLGLINTHVDGAEDPLRNEALPYSFIREWGPITTYHPSGLFGCGDIISTPYELNVFINNLFNGNLVSENSLSEMKTAEANLGLGMFAIPFNDRLAYGHNGGMPGFLAVTEYFPEERVSVSYTTNGVRFALNNILIGVLSIVFNEDYDVPVFENPIVLPIEILERYIGVYESPDIALLANIFFDNETLMCQATGQGAFAPEALDEFNFVFDAADVKIEFLPDTGKMIIIQYGQKYNFKMIDSEF